MGSGPPASIGGAVCQCSKMESMVPQELHLLCQSISLLFKVLSVYNFAFRETTFKLDVDFELFVTLWFYEEGHGWKSYREKILEGSNNNIKVVQL